MPARITNPEKLNSLEVMQVIDHMEKQYGRDLHYNITNGNSCVWVYWGSINLYYIFRESKIIDIQVD